LPDKLNRNADLIGFYRLANNPKAVHAKLIASHCARTRELMDQAAGVVLVIHDTTEIDFSGLESVEDLGPIGHGGCSGYLCHNSLAYDYQAREVLGWPTRPCTCAAKCPRENRPKPNAIIRNERVVCGRRVGAPWARRRPANYG